MLQINMIPKKEDENGLEMLMLFPVSFTTTKTCYVRMPDISRCASAVHKYFMHVSVARIS